MNQVEFKNSEISGNIAVDGKRWQTHIIPSGSTDAATVAATVAANLKESASYVEHLLHQAFVNVGQHIALGERVTLEGLGRIELTGEGSSMSEDASWDPTRNAIGLAFIPAKAIQDAVADIVPVNVLKPVSIQVLGLQDAETLEQNVLVAGHVALIQGKGVKIVAAQEDEGVFLVKDDKTYRCTVTDSTAGTVDATVPSEVPAGEGYALELRGRAGQGTNRQLVTARRMNVTVKAA